MEIWKRLAVYLLKAAAGCAGVLAILLLGLTVAEYKPLNSEALEVSSAVSGRSIREGERIEVLTFNVGYGGLDAGMDSFLHGGARNTPESREKVEENMRGMIGLIGEQTYDVLFLQEVDRHSKRSYYMDEAQMMREELGGTGAFAQNFRCLFIPYPVPDFIGTVSSGLQTQTGLAVRSAERVALPTGLDWPMRIFRMKPCMLVMRVPVEDSGRELVLINLQMNEHADGTADPVQTLAELMREEYEAGNYVIAGGDFNRVFPEDDFSAYPVRDGDVYMPERLDRDMFGNGWTFASDVSFPTRRLLDEPYDAERWWAQYYVTDGFILSPNVTLEEVRTLDGEFQFSDHNPVKLAVRLEK